MERRRVLIIEDDPQILGLIRETLEAEGFLVAGLDHPRQVEGLDARYNPDVILVDLMLPGASGVQVAEYLRENGFLHTPMIAMSADRLTLLFASRSGLFQDTMVKPFDVDTLLGLIEEYSGRYITYPTGFAVAR